MGRFVWEDLGWSDFGGLPIEEIQNWIEKQGENKPCWSEEDELNLKGIIDEIEANKNSAPSYDLPTYDKYLNWLKSLKNKIINE